MEIPRLSVYCNKVAQGTAALDDGGGQDLLDRLGQPLVAGAADARSRGFRVDPGAEQAFAGVDVADADHDVAGQQHLLDRRAALARLAPQQFAGKAFAQRLHAEAAQQHVLFQIAFFLAMPEHGAEAARVVQAQHLPAFRARICPDNHQVEVVVLARLDPGRQHPQVAGHAQMDDEGAVLELNQQVLAAAVRTEDAVSGQQLGQSGREGPAQAFAAQHDLLDDTAFDMGRDTAPGNFYFWEFGHGKGIV
ncbi:hypothetical protein MASSI9I_51083 [Massilia sp. 9I]|nr:hypothetical protein MASSI9I_51083 [Massilia sp. 9I]